MFLIFNGASKRGGTDKKVGAGDRSRTYTGVSPEDFESSASAIPPLRHVNILGQDSLVSNFISAIRKIGVRDDQD
jgi:hypothetical protein